MKTKSKHQLRSKHTKKHSKAKSQKRHNKRQRHNKTRKGGFIFGSTKPKPKPKPISPYRPSFLKSLALKARNAFRSNEEKQQQLGIDIEKNRNIEKLVEKSGLNDDGTIKEEDEEDEEDEDYNNHRLAEYETRQ
uniref:Uncharacterized protein n=1 Tax=viral metagenome TaxID=1070528 RepID=A0A6C0JXC1_9ZZZZ